MAVTKIVEHAPEQDLVLVGERPQYLGSRRYPSAADVVQHRLPKGAALFHRAFRDSPDPALIAPEPHAEHVSAHLAADPLALELGCQVLEYLVCQLGERSTPATRGRQLCDEDGGLANDCLNQLDRHTPLGIS
jgi:hypothetical protein